jgi:hypothetical protein
VSRFWGRLGEKGRALLKVLAGKLAVKFVFLQLRCGFEVNGRKHAAFTFM